jgi:hypothetical protein
MIHLYFRNACKHILKIRAKGLPIILSYQLAILSIPALILCCTVATLEGTESPDAWQSLWRIPLSTVHFVVVSTKQTFKTFMAKKKSNFPKQRKQNQNLLQCTEGIIRKSKLIFHRLSLNNEHTEKSCTCKHSSTSRRQWALRHVSHRYNTCLPSADFYY